VQYVHLTATGLVVCVEFLCAVPIVFKTGDQLFTLTCKLLDCFGLPTSQLVGFCSDGGSEFRGKNVGLINRLKGWLLNLGHKAMISVHCVAHRAALVMKDSSDAEDPAVCSSWLR
jgi:hypothetical protein